MKNKKLSVALVGMRFGAAFVPIYKHHPDVAEVAIVDTDPNVLNEVGDRYDIRQRYTNLEAVLGSKSHDAVHLVTPIPLHAKQSIAILKSNKHCACTVPMACSISDLKAIINAKRESGKNYMMMETAVYTRQFLLAKELVSKGKMGRIQFLRGAHYQDMENWPSYWMGLPPMWYATHAVSPCLAISNTRAKSVQCLGSGTMRKALHKPYGNPFPFETALFELDRPGLNMEITRSLFHTSRGYTESFNVYGEWMTFEWPQVEGEDKPLLFTATATPGNSQEVNHRGRSITTERVDAPDRQDLLPKEIARFTVRGKYDDTNPHKSFDTGGGHHGSHPHLVHEFVRSIVEGRKPWIDEVRAAAWTAAGICAHASAMKNGKRVLVPDFRK